LPHQVIESSDRLIQQICAGYGLITGPHASITRVTRGAVGQIWRLDLGGERYAVKELFWGADEQSVRREAALTAGLAAAGIRLPGSVPGRDGRFLVRLSGELGGGWLRLYQWIDGVPIDPAAPDPAGRAGGLLGRVHAHAAPPQGEPDPWFETVPAAASWDLLAEAARAQGAGWGPGVAARAGLLRELAGLVTPVPAAQMITCHRDLHPDNVLVDGSGELVLLDWDDVGPASPDHELARLLAEWHVEDGRADAAAIARTLAAYRAAGGPGRVRDEYSFGMLIASRLNFLQSQASVALDVRAAPDNRNYAAAEILDTLARLPTPELIAELIGLAAAGGA
jgi:Ser/Thr protein kinase RdoA (MazF antagonist)